MNLVRRTSRLVCGAVFVATGILHFSRPRSFERIVPPGFGDPRLLVLLSGAAELAGGLAIIGLRERRAARWWVVALLVAVFPANIYMALEPDRTGAGSLPGWLLWARLPLQPLLIWWVWTVTRRAAPAAAPAAGG